MNKEKFYIKVAMATVSYRISFPERVLNDAPVVVEERHLLYFLPDLKNLRVPRVN